MPSLYDRTFGPTEEELLEAERPSFRMPSAGRRTPIQGPQAPGVPLKDRALGLGEAAATVGSLVAGAVPAGVATMMALPFEGVRGAAKRGQQVSEAMTYLPRSEAGIGALEALEKPMAAMGAPGAAAGEEVMRRTGSPLLATATEMVVQPLNLLAAPAVGRGAARGARAAGRAAKAAGRELGPKAAEMAEGYMRRAGLMPEITVYHGSPHVFAPEEGAPLGRFRSEKIGTGEGAQAYGHGLYLAEEPKVATGYREKLAEKSPNVFRLADKDVSITGGPAELKRFSDAAESQGYSKESVALAYQTLRDQKGDLDAASGELMWRDDFTKIHDDAAKLLREMQYKPEGGGLYTVDLPDPVVDKMLDWDKPLSQQGQIGRSIIEALQAEELLPKAMRRNEGRLTGRDAYEVFSDFLSPAGASREFQGLGIPGIKFLDEGSRGNFRVQNKYKGENYGSPVSFKTEERALNYMKEMKERGWLDTEMLPGTRNFVVFPGEEKNLTILQRNEQRLPQTDTPAFKEFTGGAPVIKADQASKAEFQTGKPVVIEGFSGTRRDFSEIDPALSSSGYFLSSKPVVADEYAGVYPEGMGGGSFPTGGNIQRSFVRMDNPLFVNARGASFNRIDTRGIPGFGLPMSNTDMLNHWAKQQGYDGVIYKDLRDSISRPGGQNAPASNVYVSFKPNYVKSAIGNRGTFDVQSRDMTKAQGGAVQGNSMGYSQTADMIAAKLMDQGVGRQQALQMALRMADAHMKAGGAVMMARGGRLAEGMKRAAAASREEQAKRAVEAAKKARATKAERESRQTAREAQGAAQPLTGALRPAVEPVRGRTSQELQAMQQQQLTPEQQELFSQMQQRYSGFGEAAKFMTPQEVGKIISRPESVEAVSRLMSVLPTAENLAAVAKAGEPKRGWYRASAQAIMDVFGPQDAPRFTALLAAMSPQTSVEMNLLNTLNTWKNWTAAGRPTDPAQIRRVLGQSVSGTKGEQSVLEAWAQNSVRALATPDPLEITLSGPKVDSFYRNLADDVYRVTNDAWMASGLGVNQGLFSGAPTALQLSRGDPGLTPGYIGTSARMREAGQRAGILPSEAQETTWSFFMPLYEMQAKTGLPAREILQRGLLTPETIRGTPDFATLLNQGRYGDILKQAGYEQQLAGLKPSAFGLKARDLSLPEQREVESAARRLEGLREMRGTEKRSRAISLPSSQRPPRTAFAVEPHEYIPGSGVRLGESMVTAPLGTRQTYSSEISKLFRDPMERDRLQMAAGLKPLPTRAGTGSFRPPGGIPYQGRAGEPARTQRMPLETQPAFASVAEVPLTPSGQGVTKEAKDKLAAAAALRGYMTGQLGSTYNVQIPSKKGESMIVPLEKKADPDAMRYTYQYLDDAGFLADTGAGVNVLYNPYKPGNRPFSDVEMKEVSQLLGGKEVIPARTVSDYIDYSEAFGAPQGSGKATKQMLGYLDPLTPKQRAAMSAEAKDIAGSLYDLYTRKGEATGDEYRVDIMRALQILRDKGVPGLTAALAAGEALPAQEGALPR